MHANPIEDPKKVVATLEKEVKEKTKIALAHDAAIHKVTKKVPTILSDKTIEDTRVLLFENTKKFDTINYVYVVNEHHKLVGVFSLKEVFKSPPETPVKKIMTTSLVKAHPATDQEKIAHLAIKNNLKAIPIVNDKMEFQGVVPSDQIHTILDHESKEDLLRFAGIILGKRKLDDTGAHPLISSFLTRTPWILIGILGTMVTAHIILSFNETLEKNLILAGFIPLIAYVANAVGTQSQTLFVRDLATKPKFSFLPYFAKQMIVSTMIGIAGWLLLILLTTLLWSNPMLGVIVGFAILVATLTASLIALVMPKLLTTFGLDPAIGSGPFSTVIQDLLSISIYFYIATTFLT